MPKRSVQRRLPRPTGQVDLQQPHRGQPRCPVLPQVLRRFIPADVLQIITEYTDRITSVLSHRSVSRRWYRAVGLAMSFLNNRNSTSVGYLPSSEWVLRRHFDEDDCRTVLHCCVLCMRDRLEQLAVDAPDPAPWPMRLLGERNDTLKCLLLEGIAVDEGHVGALQHYTALRSVWFVEGPLDSAMLETLVLLLPSLESLRMKQCDYVRDVSMLARCQALRELRLNSMSEFNVQDSCVDALARIRTLTSLSLACCPHIRDVSGLVACPALETLDLYNTGVDAAGISGLERIPTLRSLNVSGCHELRDVSSLRGSASLQTLALSLGNADVGNAGYQGLDLLPVLQKLDVDFMDGGDVADLLRRLQLPTSLQHLVVRDCSFKDCAALTGIERILPLETLDFEGCKFLRNASWLTNCASLRSLSLKRCKSLVDSGIGRFGGMKTLTELNLADCGRIKNVACLRSSTSLRALNLARTSITSSGIAGLECIPSLTLLDLESCKHITSVTCLRSSRSLRVLNLSFTGITTEGLTGLCEIPTLELLGLRMDRRAAKVDVGVAGVAEIADFSFERINWLETDSLEARLQYNFDRN
jgi:hypothetical protein